MTNVNKWYKYEVVFNLKMIFITSENTNLEDAKFQEANLFDHVEFNFNEGSV